MYCLGSVSSFHVSLCLMSHDCALTVSVLDIAKCLVCAETLAFIAENRLLITSNGCFCGCCCFMAIMCLDNCALTISQSQTF